MGQYNPLTPDERVIIEKLLHGEQHELDLLRAQYESALLKAQIHDSPLLGFIPRRKIFIVHRPNQVSFSVGNPQNELGDRRSYWIDDVSGVTEDDRHLRFALLVKNGLIDTLRVIAATDASGAVIQGNGIQLNRIRVREACYVSGTPDTIGEPLQGRRRTFRDIAGIPDTLDNGTEWQSWLLALDTLRIPRDTRGMYPQFRALQRPMSVRRARPALREEIEAFERRSNLTVSKELQELWRVSNGMFLLDYPFFGTYDAETQIEDAGNTAFVVIFRNWDEQTYVVSEARAEIVSRPEVTPVREYYYDSARPLRTWMSLREFIQRWIERCNRQSER